MTVEQERRAAEVVRIAQRGELGEAGTDLVALFVEAVRKGGEAEALTERERAKREGIEREANALAAVLADVLDLAARGVFDRDSLDEIVDDLPEDARRRVIAYRHASGPLGGLPAQDQHGRLPRVPPRASVMRTRTRVIDMESL